MSETLPEVEVHGALRPALRAKLGGELDLEAAGGGAAVLIDGRGGGYDGDHVREALAGGRQVVLVEPGEAQLRDLAALTGGMAPLDAPAVSVAHSAAGYRLGVLPATVERTAATGEAHPAGAVEIAPEASLAAGIASLVKAGPGTAAGDSLVGPLGSYSGSFSIYFPWRLELPAVNAKEFNVDPFLANLDHQVLSSSCESTFYVYWVDGSEPPPHYLVILRQKAIFGTGDELMVNEYWIKGYGMYSAKTEVRNMTSSAPGIELLHVSPENGGDEASVRFDVSMSQFVQGGREPAPATLQEGVKLTLPEWTVLNRASPPNAKWEFIWNKAISGFNREDVIINNYFQGRDFVRDFPAITRSGLRATTYAAWRARNDRADKVVKLTFGLELLQSFLMMALWFRRPKGESGGVANPYGAGLQSFELNLAAIAKPPQ